MSQIEYKYVYTVAGETKLNLAALQPPGTKQNAFDG